MTPSALLALAKGDIENFMAASAPSGIERQEKRGQIEQSFRETLPKDLGGFPDDNPKSDWEKLGFVFGSVADDLFINVQFPEGWRKSPTDHSMWTDILDDKGRKRGGIFYKAAFYDRSASASLVPRFRVSYTYESPYRVFVEDATGKVNQEITGIVDRSGRERAREDISEWLTKNFPGWESPSAHWD